MSRYDAIRTCHESNPPGRCLSVVGGGLAGIVTALELLDRGKSVLLIEKDTEAKFLGGLAKESLAAFLLVGTPHQKRSRIPDSPDLAYRVVGKRFWRI